MFLSLEPCDRGRLAINILDHTTDNKNDIGRLQLVVTLLKPVNIYQCKFMSESQFRKMAYKSNSFLFTVISRNTWEIAGYVIVLYGLRCHGGNMPLNSL